jgi:hypothetical protein
MATSSPSTALTFLRLPAEIRQLIYTCLLHDPPRAVPVGPRPSSSTLGPGIAISRPNILKVCHQIYEEATPLFYTLNTFNVGKDPGRARAFFVNSTTQTLAYVRHLEVFSLYTCYSGFAVGPSFDYELRSYNSGYRGSKNFAKALCDLTRRATNIKTFTMHFFTSLCYCEPFNSDSTRLARVFAESHPTLKRAAYLLLPADSDEIFMYVDIVFVTEEYVLKPGVCCHAC